MSALEGIEKLGDVVTEDWRRAGFLCRRFFSLYRCASLSRSSFARRCFDLGRAREARGSKKLRRARVDLLNFLNGGGKKGARERERESASKREKSKAKRQRCHFFFLFLSFRSFSMTSAEAMAVDAASPPAQKGSSSSRFRLQPVAELVGHDGRCWGIDWSPEGE